MNKIDKLFKSAETNQPDALLAIHFSFIYFMEEFKIPVRAVTLRTGISYGTLYKYINNQETPSVRCAERLMSFVTELIGLKKAFLKIIEVGDFTKPAMNQYMKLIYKHWGISIARAEFHAILHSDLSTEERARLMVKDLIVMNFEEYKSRELLKKLKARVMGTSLPTANKEK